MTAEHQDPEAVAIGIAGQAIFRILEVLDRARRQVPLAATPGDAADLEEAIRVIEDRLMPIAAGYARACALMVGTDQAIEGRSPGQVGLHLAHLAELHDPRIHGGGVFRRAVQAHLSSPARGRLTASTS